MDSPEAGWPGAFQPSAVSPVLAHSFLPAGLSLQIPLLATSCLPNDKLVILPSAVQALG